MKRCKSSFLVMVILTAVFGAGSLGTVLADANGANHAPKVPFKYALGKDKFQAMCSSCHGKWGGGSEQGPPMLHGYYKPSHHGDAAFYRAALKGVKAHHWSFGDMPPVPGATRQDLDAIVSFIRWLQQEKGLY